MSRRHLLPLLLLLLLVPVARAADEPEKAAVAPQAITLRNRYAEVTIGTTFGSVRQFVLLGHAPVTLPKHLQFAAVPQTSAGLAVLGAFNETHSSNHVILADDQVQQDGSTKLVYGLGVGISDPWTITAQSDTSLTLEARRGDLRFTRRYTMDDQRPTVRCELLVDNAGTQNVTLNPRIYPLNGIHQDYGPGESTYCSAFIYHRGADKVDYWPPPAQGAPEQSLGSTVDAEYVGLKSRFFAAWWTPEPLTVGVPGVVSKPVVKPAVQSELPFTPAQVTATTTPQYAWNAGCVGFRNESRFESHGSLVVQYDAVIVPPGSRLTQAYAITVSGMTATDRALLSPSEQYIEFTDWFYRFFKVLAKAMIWILGGIYSLVHNYGVAVILLTLAIKVVLYRTTYKQHESMLKMQKLAPEMKYIQEQYKDDKQKAAMKQMELFKKHGVNPLGGCLPMLIQIPIFIALFQAFNHSADMRGTGFLWIHDMTLPDQVWGTAPIAFLGGFVLSLNPLPILYIIVTIWMTLQQKPPTGGDPMQEQMFKIMRWMPVMFGVIFYNMPSGLVLYFTVQAVISTIEIKIIKKKLGM